MQKNNDLIFKTFEGHDVHTFVWNGRVCWLGREIINILEYVNSSKVISECIAKLGFEEDIEYKILRGEELIEFRKMVNSIIPDTLSIKIRNLTILYEPGLYGVFQYSTRPAGVRFSQWIRREVVLELREMGYYILGERQERETLTKKQKTTDETIGSDIKSFMGNIDKAEWSVAYDMLILLERAIKEGGLLLETTLQVLNRLGIDTKKLNCE